MRRQRHHCKACQCLHFCKLRPSLPPRLTLMTTKRHRQRQRQPYPPPKASLTIPQSSYPNRYLIRARGQLPTNSHSHHYPVSTYRKNTNCSPSYPCTPPTPPPPRTIRISSITMIPSASNTRINSWEFEREELDFIEVSGVKRSNGPY